MTEQIKFEKLKHYSELLEKLRTTGSMAFDSIDDKVVMGDLYKSLYNVPNPQLACDSCVRYYLELLAAYNHREYPKYLASLEPVVEITEVENKADVAEESESGNSIPLVEKKDSKPNKNKNATKKK